MSGVKHDHDKLRYDLIPPQPMKDVASVLTYGAAKYSPDNWTRVSDGERRYYAAAMRHLEQWRLGETLDSESGLPHIAHATACLMFLSAISGKRT